MHYLVLEIPEVPAAQNAKNKLHWGARHGEAEEWAWVVRKAMKGDTPWTLRPKQPLKRAQITITRHSHRMLDFDGVVGSMKPVVDALVKNKVLIDDSWAVTGAWFVNQQFRPKKDGPLTVIIVEELHADPTEND